MQRAQLLQIGDCTSWHLCWSKQKALQLCFVVFQCVRRFLPPVPQPDSSWSYLHPLRLFCASALYAYLLLQPCACAYA